MEFKGKKFKKEEVSFATQRPVRVLLKRLYVQF
jgi:hypothetical protein